MGVKADHTRILPSKRAGFYYLEFCRIHMEGDRLVYAVSEGASTREWNIPTANTSAILLGSGSSITQAAARRLADERTLVAFVGGGGTPIFLGSLSEYAPTEHLVRWVGFWNDPAARLAAAKDLAESRCRAIRAIWPSHHLGLSPEVPLPHFEGRIQSASSVEALRGFEGDFAKAAYKETARATGIAWNGRQAGIDEQDLANAFLDQGNYMAYGAAGVVLWALGIPPGLAVNHGVTRAGGLVFDLADAVKDAIVLPLAFKHAAAGSRKQEFRDGVNDAFERFEVLPNLFHAMLSSIDAGASGL